MKPCMTGTVALAIPAILMLLSASLIYAPPALAYPDYVWGEASAGEATEEHLQGYWEYCITIGWDVSEYVAGAHGASHVSMLLELEACLADCGGMCFVLPDTVGSSDGIDGCTIYFYSEVDLKGDPTVPADAPTIKFEPYPGICEPDIAGTAHVCFYSLIPPQAGDTPPGSIWIKFGPYTEEGLITGLLPSCRGTAAVGHSTWSSIKRLFR